MPSRLIGVEVHQGGRGWVGSFGAGRCLSGVGVVGGVGGGHPRRRRRSNRRVRQLIVQAAQELFAERGYRGASTREIARRADVMEVVIYGNFGTKAKLFEEAVCGPLRAAVAEFVRVWGDRAGVEGVDPGRRAGDYAGALYELLWDNRGLLRALVAAGADDGVFAAGLRGMFGGLSEVTGAIHAGCDPGDRLQAQILLGAVLGAVVHENLVFPVEGAPDPHTLRVVLRRNWPCPGLPTPGGKARG
jgi:Bacterial regulatory proteins, tetR family